MSQEMTRRHTDGVSDAWKNARGRVHNSAIPTDITDSSLKECDCLGLVVRGCTVPLRAAYNGIVDDVVNVNTIGAVRITSDESGHLRRTGMIRTDPLPEKTQRRGAHAGDNNSLGMCVNPASKPSGIGRIGDPSSVDDTVRSQS